MNIEAQRVSAVLNSVNDRNKMLEKENKELKERVLYLSNEVATLRSQVEGGASSVASIIKSFQDKYASQRAEVEYWRSKALDKT